MGFVTRTVVILGIGFSGSLAGNFASANVLKDCQTTFMRSPSAAASRSTVAETIDEYAKQGVIINLYLRGKADADAAEQAKFMMQMSGLSASAVDSVVNELDSILRQTAQNQEKKVVYRAGAIDPKELYVGASRLYLNYLSTTNDQKIALSYARAPEGKSKILYVINVPAKTGGQINELAPEGFRAQDEFLLPRGGKIEIRSLSYDGDLAIAHADFTPPEI